jgi:hypothetical protein
VFTIIVKISEVVDTRSGSFPITLIVHVAIGFDLETHIEPVVESTLMRSLVLTSKFPFELSTPEYVHVVEFEPQLRVAENGVIGIFISETLYAIEKVFYD